jgi:hypothetical protein
MGLSGACRLSPIPPVGAKTHTRATSGDVESSDWMGRREGRRIEDLHYGGDHDADQQYLRAR